MSSFKIVGSKLIAAFSIWNRNPYGRVLGVFTASVSAMIVLFTVNAYPFAAFMLFLIDIMVIYGLVVYGGKDRASA